MPVIKQKEIRGRNNIPGKTGLLLHKLSATQYCPLVLRNHSCKRTGCLLTDLLFHRNSVEVYTFGLHSYKWSLVWPGTSPSRAMWPSITANCQHVPRHDFGPRHQTLSPAVSSWAQFGHWDSGPFSPVGSLMQPLRVEHPPAQTRAALCQLASVPKDVSGHI